MKAKPRTIKQQWAQEYFQIIGSLHMAKKLLETLSTKDSITTTVDGHFSEAISSILDTIDMYKATKESGKQHFISKREGNI